MKKTIIWFITLSYTFLFAETSFLLEAKEGIKIIGDESITFLSVDRENMSISKSQNIELSRIHSRDILGNMPCSPLYSCPNKLEEYFRTVGIENNSELLLYDDNYGVGAATLFILLESIGHEKMKILNGGSHSINHLDPNRKIYERYIVELKKIRNKLLPDNNASSEMYKKDKSSIIKKLKLLKPLLLVDTYIDKNLSKTNYTVDRKKFNMDYILSRNQLNDIVKSVKEKGKNSNMKIIDSCSMIDIIGSNDGSYLPGVLTLNWYETIDYEKKGYKTKESLEKIFLQHGLDKENEYYLYCMSGSPKAFYLLMAMRIAGYEKVKAFSGDWDSWKGGL